MLASSKTPLHDYILSHADYYQVYERYQPDKPTLAQIVATGIKPHVRIYYTAACGECARHLPALARIAEHLPGWTWELISDRAARLKEIESRLSTPVIVLSDASGIILGTINGGPLRGSLEADLLHYVSNV